jgi:heme exporter protein D
MPSAVSYAELSGHWEQAERLNAYVQDFGDAERFGLGRHLAVGIATKCSLAAFVTTCLQSKKAILRDDDRKVDRPVTQNSACRY